MALKGAPAWQWAELYNPTGDDVTPQSHLIIIFTRIEIIWQARSIILFCEEAKTKMWQLKPKIGSLSSRHEKVEKGYRRCR